MRTNLEHVQLIFDTNDLPRRRVILCLFTGLFIFLTPLPTSIFLAETN